MNDFKRRDRSLDNAKLFQNKHEFTGRIQIIVAKSSTVY